MVLTVIAMDNTEKFLRFIDPDLISITETNTLNGFRTVKVEYTFQDLKEDKLLFKMGNKLWIQGDANLADCLYVIDTQVKEDVYKENTISFEAEEVLVELNYAPLFSQTELSNSDFKTVTTNGKMEVVVNWNALNYWFGTYFNIGVVQECISEYASKLTITGTITRMNLLRYIEEETGNVFVTRYEKDILTNVIHRYLDFVNPINAAKDWMLNVEYTFLPPETSMTIYDADGNVTTDTYIDVEEEDDIVVFNDVTSYTNLDPDNVVFRITNGEDVLNTDGLPYDEDNEEDTPLIWDSDTIGFENNYNPVVVTLIKQGGNIGLDCNDKSYSIPVGDTVEPIGNGYLTCINNDTLSPVNIQSAIPDDSYFEMYDTETNKVIYRTLINNRIGTVHEEILDFGFNMENVVFETDESETINAISPVLNYDNNDFTRTQINNIINDWKGTSIVKGQVYPLTVQKVTVSSDSLENAKRSLGSYTDNSGANVSTNISSNYWRRPKRPNDNSGQSYEFLRGVTYWTAPFDKSSTDIHIETDNITGAEYTHILNRTDDRNNRGITSSPKMGALEITEEDPYAIYGLLAQELRNTQYPTIDIEVDIANLRGHEYNNYELHDKIYIKLPDSQELVTAKIVETSKEAHDIAKNSVKLSNYSINTYKTIQETTYIEAENQQFSYPQSKTLTARLINADNTNGVQYPASKLLVFNIYSDSNNELIKTYTKLTDGNGYAKIQLKLNPGDYSIDIGFYGDEEYMESVLNIDCNIDGTNEVADSKTKAPQKAKTTSKTNKTSSTAKTVKTYWSKCGKSPDKKKVRAIAKPSGPDANNYKYQFYDTIFKNKCPICKHEGTLVFDGGKANKCVTSAGARDRGYKINIPEHEITCNHCDSDFCGVTGIEKWPSPRGRLKTLEKPKKAGKHDFGKLTKGQMVYGTQKVSNKKKTMGTSKTRNAISSNISNTLKQKAKSICKGSTGLAAAKKIAQWCGKNISYCKPLYTGFKYKPETVLRLGYGNCCDQTRLMLSLMDAAGCLETLTLKYVHVCCNSKYHCGHVFAQVVDSKGNKRYVDPCKSASPWGNYVTGWGSPPGTQKTYPTLPI